MDTPRPGDTPPEAAPPAASFRSRALWALAPILFVGAASYFLYRVSPVLLLISGAVALGWLVWGVAQALLRHTGPAWLLQAVAGGIWLVYAMRLVYGWREEMGYAASLWHVFGWAFLSTLFWGLLLIGAVRLLEKWMKP